MLYPAVLSVFLRGGIATEWLPFAAGLFGCICHLGSTWLVYRSARRAWASDRAGLWAAALFGFNPVAVYFAAEPLDTTFALFLFLAGLDLFHSRWPWFLDTIALNAADGKFVAVLAGVGALWGLAVLARPHYAIVLAAAPCLLTVFLWRRPRLLLAGAGALMFAAGSLLCLAGAIQRSVTGEFRIMPTQGAYSLWAGNRPGANGRYFEQKIHLPAGDVMEGDNPARIESRILYQRETGAAGSVDIQAETHYWRKRTMDSILANPVEWLELMAKKIYFLFNNFEQYNNKTYAVQKSLSPVLRYNPLGWGATLVLTAAGLALACAPPKRPFRGGLLTLAVAFVYATGVVLFFVSDRFRLPLLPFLCIGAGAWGLFTVEQLRSFPTSRIIRSGTAALLAAVLTFSRAFGVYDLTPAVQDFVALSIASGKAGDDLGSLGWARKALAVRPDHPDALVCAVNGYFNCRLRGTDPGDVFADETWSLQLERVHQLPQPTAGVRLVYSVALWKTGRSEDAQTVLRSLHESEPSTAAGAAVRDDALGILLLTGLQSPGEENRARLRGGDTESFYLLVALARRETPTQLLIPSARREMVSDLVPFVRQLFP
jgi:4-amino-4-deoxy-L-arabinose transferase-like glycosyltransferase